MNTHEEIERRVARLTEASAQARKALALSAEAGADLSRLAQAMHDVAHNAGELLAWTDAESITRLGTERGLDEETVLDNVRQQTMSRMVRGADDSWSGRGNDTARSEHDGYLRGARAVLDVVCGVYV